MCRCWLRCWEDFYWNCIEEKFCYDETIANYNPEEDEYYQKKPNGNGFLSDNKLENNNSSPVCIQPSMGRSNPRTPNISAGKIHEEDYRQIQTNAPILAPEIMSVFSNSQIFHEHHPVIKKNNFPGVHGKGGREADSEKLLFRLEGNDIVDTASNTTAGRSVTAPPQIDVTDHSLPSSKTFASIREEDGDDDDDDDDNDNDDDDGVILRPHLRADSIGAAVLTKSTPILNKQLEKVQSVPHLSSRPVSENDIFSICGSMGMTPEIPSISYTTLPKNYADTPTIEKYRETVSLYSIQSAASARVSQQDLTMPRYFRRTGVSAQSVDNLSMGAGSSGSSGSGVGMGMVFTNPNGGRSTASGAAKTGVEKSKRLKMLRTKLPPLSIHLGGARERSKDKGIE